MITISKDSLNVNVMVVMNVEPEHQQELVDLALGTQHIFKKQPGFIGSVLMRSADGKRLIHYMQWESMEAHLACMGSADFQGQEGKRFMAFIESGKATMEPQVYDVISSL